MVGIICHDDNYESILSNFKEIKARGSPLIILCPEEDEEAEKYSDAVLKIPQINPLLSPFTFAVALQLLAYRVAKERGCPIDHLRNLAKSVTVE